MLTVNNNFKLAVKGSAKQFRMRFVQQNVDVTPLEFSGQDILTTVTLDEAGQFNQAVGALATCTLLGHHTQFEVEQDFQGILSTKYGSTWYDAQFFNGTIIEINYSEDQTTTTLKLHNAILIGGNTNYDTTTQTFPQTVESLAESVANLLGVQLASGFSSLLFADYVIPVDVFSNQNQLKYRDVLVAIAQITATTALINEDGELEFRPIQTTPVDSFSDEQLFKLKIKNFTGYLNQLALTRPPAIDAVQVSDDESIEDNGLSVYAIPNNQIMNAERADFMADLFAEYTNFNYYESEITTTGLGYFEVGDMVEYDDGSDATPMYITQIKSTWSKTGFQEDFFSQRWYDGSVNQATAGGIMSTLMNAQLIVDHQQNQITSIVEEFDTLSDTVASNYTELSQDIDDITLTVQSMGGINLVQDSVGFLLGNPSPGIAQLWTQSGTGTKTAQPDNDSTNFGAISSNSISLNGASPKITQVVQKVSVVNKYALSLYVYKGVAGSVQVRLSNGSDDFQINIAAGTAYNWVQFKLEDIQPTVNGLTIEISAAGTTDFKFTDLLLNQGQYSQEWGVAQGEAMSANAIFTSSGLQIKSTNYPGDATFMTPLGFSGYSAASGSPTKVLSLDRDATKTKTIQTGTNAFSNPASTQDGAIDYNGIIVAVPVPSGVIAGLAFVKGANA